MFKNKTLKIKIKREQNIMRELFKNQILTVKVEFRNNKYCQIKYNQRFEQKDVDIDVVQKSRAFY